MKKIYITPKMLVVDLSDEALLVTSSLKQEDDEKTSGGVGDDEFDGEFD